VVGLWRYRQRAQRGHLQAGGRHRRHAGGDLQQRHAAGQRRGDQLHPHRAHGRHHVLVPRVRGRQRRQRGDGATASYTAPTLDTTAPAGTLAVNSGAAYNRCGPGDAEIWRRPMRSGDGYYVSTQRPGRRVPARRGGRGDGDPQLQRDGGVPPLATPDVQQDGVRWYKDAAGNVSAVASDSITLDQTAPSNGTVTATPGSGQVTLACRASAIPAAGLTRRHTNTAGGRHSPARRRRPAATARCWPTARRPASPTPGSRAHTYSYRVCVPTTSATWRAGRRRATRRRRWTRPRRGHARGQQWCGYTGSTGVTLNLAATDAIGVTGYYVSTSATGECRAAGGRR